MVKEINELAATVEGGKVEYMITVHSGKDERLPITRVEFNTLWDKISYQSLEKELAEGTYSNVAFKMWKNHIGYVACEDEASCKLVRDLIDTTDVDGKFYKAWAKDEKTMHRAVTIKIPKTMTQAPFTDDKILKAISMRYKWNSASWRLAERMPIVGSPE